jgi:hypothetical protein
MFVAAGRDVPNGRAIGRPELRGVSAAVVDLMGLDASWPRTGVAPWARSAPVRDQTATDKENG